MTHRWDHSVRYSLRLLAVSLAVALAVVACVATGAARADDAPAAPSLKLVPQDASFYAAMLRNRQQVEIIAKSNFWKRLNEVTVVKQMWASVEEQKTQPGSPLHSFFQGLEAPENQQALEVLRDIFSDEVFVYGGPDFGDALVVANGATNAARIEQVTQDLTHVPFRERQIRTMRAVFDSLNEDLEQLKVPELVIAMHMKNKEAAEEQFHRIEGYARVLPEHVPQLAALRGKFKSVRLGDSQFLTLTVDENMIPWDVVPFEQTAANPGDYDKLREKLKGLKIVIALGMHHDYVVLSIGKSIDHLANWAKGDVLSNQPKLKVVHNQGDKQFTGISYVSKRMSETTGLQARDLDRVLHTLETDLPKSELSADDQKQILADARQVADSLKANLPKRDAQVAFSYLTPNGIEGYHYDWTQNAFLDGTKQLPVLAHLGANPVLALAFRRQSRPQDYDLVVSLLEKGRGYFEKFGLPEMNEKDRDNYKQFAEIAYPILSRADKVNRDMLLPALADGQTALVIDGSLKSKQWHEKMHATSEETAMPMPALVLGVSDAALLDKALGEYRGIINELIVKLRPLAPKAPDFELPAPETRKADGATVYYFPVADKLGVHKQLAPNGGLSDKFFVLSLSPRLTSSLLKEQKLAAAAEGPLSVAADHPLAGAVVFDFPLAVDMALPWINEGVREYVRQMEQLIEQNLADPNAEQAEDDKPLVDSQATLATLAQVKQVCELLKSWRGITSASYLQDGALVGHSEVRFQDAP